MKFKTPIIDTVNAYISKNPYRFHTPGHQGQFNFDFFCGSKADITELSFSDNLLYPNGIIKESERQTADIYGAFRSLYFTTGATTAIFVAIKSLSNFGDTILVDKKVHKSVLNAINIFRLKTIYYDVKEDCSTETAIKDIISSNKNIAGCVITSPDYFGRCVEDIENIYIILKDRGIKLIVDQSHGAHFTFSKLLPDSCVSYADYTIHSCHKTMPVFTGGALLHCKDYNLYILALKNRACIHTTSPLYMTLMSLEYAIVDLKEKGEELYNNLYEEVCDFEKEISTTSFKVENKKNRMLQDFSRLSVSCGEYSPIDCMELLQKENIYPEMVNSNTMLFILSPYNNNLKSLKGGLKKISPKKKKKLVKKVKEIKAGNFNTESKTELIDIEDAKGRILASEIGFFQPGIPVLNVGSVITKDWINFIKENKTRLFGFIDRKIIVYVNEDKI